MSGPIGRIVGLVIPTIRAVGKATRSMGRQMKYNVMYKPEAVAAAAGSSSSSRSNNAVTQQMSMSVEEAQMILNVKKEDSLESIEKAYERIFNANGPPAPAAGAAQKGPRKAPTYSHYLHSKVFRAMERIRAERGEEELAAAKPTAPAEPKISPEATKVAKEGETIATGPPPPGST